MKYFKQFTQMWEIAPKNTCVAMATQVVIYYWLNLCFKIYHSQYLFTAYGGCPFCLTGPFARFPFIAKTSACHVRKELIF